MTQICCFQLRLFIILSIYRTYSFAVTVITQDIPLSTISDQYIGTCITQGFSYFDSSSHACGRCSATGQIADTSSVNIYGDPVQCRCAIGYVKSSVDCSSTNDGTCASFTCASCLSSAGMTSYSDNSACVSCGSSTNGRSATTNDCACPTGQVLIEEDVVGNKAAEKSCQTCPTGTTVVSFDTIIAGAYYQKDLYSCRSCPDATMIMALSSDGLSYKCTCPSPSASYNLVGVEAIGTLSCISTSLSSTYDDMIHQTAATVTYHNLNSFVVSPSLTLEHYFVSAASYCNYYGGAHDNVHCQTLANLCVLQLYDDSTSICQTFQSILNARGTHYINDVFSWGQSLPWLSYTSAGSTSGSTITGSQPAASSVCGDTGYHSAVNLNNQHLRFVVSVIALNGTFLGYKNLETMLTYCSRVSPSTSHGGGSSSTSDYQTFATTLNDHAYSCDLSTLMSMEQQFYELFLTDDDSSSSSSTSTYYPVPIRITNLRHDGSNHNKKYPATKTSLCDDTDILVRRFFLYDRVSGISSTSTATSSQSLQQPYRTYLPDVIRYASYISLNIQLDPDSTGHIIAPVMTIEYDETIPGNWINSQTSSLSTYPTITTPHYDTPKIVSYTVSVSYTMNLTSFYSTVLSFFIAHMILTAIIIILRYYNWSKRNARIITNARYSTDIGGFNTRIIFEFILISMHTYVMMFFPFMVLISWYIFVTFKLQKSASFLLPPLSSPYYTPFIINLYILSFFQLLYVLIVIIYRQCNAQVYFIDWESSSISSSHKVSVWRTLFIANEYSKLSTRRRSNIIFTLFFICLILIGLNYEDDASQQPSLSSHDTSSSSNPVLRFAIMVWWWLLLSGGQVLYKYMIYERYISELPEQVFLDLCTIAKISIIILDEDYHGYYLHCRSPHPYADGTMTELTEMLSREEAGLTVDRALEDGPQDIQSFELFLSHEWHVTYMKIYEQLILSSSLLSYQQQASSYRRFMPQQNTTSIQSPSSSSSSSSSKDKMIKSWYDMMTFFRQFIDNSYGPNGLRRKCLERSYWERFLHLAPNLSIPNQPSLFYADNHYDFTSCMILGREVDMLIMNILSYMIFDIWFQHTAVSITCCYLLDLGLTKIRERYGQVRF